MTHREIILVILAALYASLALAEDFKTTDGKEYKDAKVSRVEPDGIVLRTKWGISKIYFVELPKEVQERFHYDAGKAAAYSAEQSAAQKQLRKQQEEVLRKQRQEAIARSASKPDVASDSTKPMATPGIQTLPQNKTATVSDQFHRIGAICGDGSESGGTGRGACSHPGGVRCWKYADGTCHK
jgi:hypothetical protein